MTGKRLRYGDPTHGARRLITSLLTVDDAARWTLDKKTLKLMIRESDNIRKNFRAPSGDHFSDLRSARSSSSSASDADID